MSRQEALVTPSVMQWARKRARLLPEEAAARMGQTVEVIEAWETGEKRPSLAQARKAAQTYRRSLAVFYLPEPPEEFDTLKDFRQLHGAEALDYSPELALIIRQLQSRQEWMREYLIRQGASPLPFIGSANTAQSAVELATTIRSALRATIEGQCSNASKAAVVSYWVTKIERLGICVCREGKVEIEEARGIVLADPYAPFIYVNTKDSFPARQFTLLHELVHLWINEPGLSNLANIQKNPHLPDAKIEAFCNKTAALILVPPAEFNAAWQQVDRTNPIEEQIEAMSGRFKVSDETIARRLLDMNVISQAEYERLRAEYWDRWRRQKALAGSGGDYYWNSLSFNGRLFTRTVLSARYSGQITVREACLTLGVKANNLRTLAEKARLLPPRQNGGE